MYAKTVNYDNTPEFLAAEHHVCFSATAVNTGITADSNGKKWIIAGSLIDANGKVVTVTESSGNYTPSAAPVGIAFHTVDVTEGAQPISLMVEGYVIAERLQGANVAGYAASAAFKTALPEIKLR
ncbi:hypothetical protein [Cellulosilyticum lentocellum]|uniref:Uncharacterized protein n=1 Tax=Cellulosilyticum lentocellum (strain ATCC 49066 / DSM 5427 / NCIMB 11756 / RHM5) TaxID=642492 RepID=F2JK41_CELLD|nr:hypothetical protein [Cellulosilyticum lentocellum]ADZ84456.1 hypothetical protein Clole_2757 [Cellulosilyticum lentocellum DSM 5427]